MMHDKDRLMQTDSLFDDFWNHWPLRALAIVALLLGFAVLANNLVGCGPSQARAGHEVLNTITEVADPTYELAVDTCDAARDVIIARTGTTYEEDRAAMDQIHAVCDPMVFGFEALIGTQQTARAALVGGLSAAAAAAIQRGLELWGQLQELVPNILTLGQTSGGETL
jgi:hypothetical protein